MMKPRLSSISCFFCCIFLSSFLAKTLVSLPLPRPDQVDILLAFKNEFYFSSTICDIISPATKSWTKDTTVFDGVGFDNETGVVTELHLHDACLSGSLKANSSLFKFQHLRYLDLSGNNLVGEVPSSVCNLSRLTYLDLSINELTGNFPFIYNITKLSVIDLSFNHFSGTIPSSLFTMPFLSSLDLTQNHLKDPLITMNSSSSPKLKKLFLGKNLFSGGILKPISKLVSLTQLDLSHNDISSSPLPSGFGKLTKLELLNLEDNGFIGELPSTINNLSHLTYLLLSNNKFAGPIPSSLLTMSSSLSYLDLSGNHLNDPLHYSNSSSSSSKLQILNLGGNSFSAQILEPILKLVDLTELKLSFLNITFPINFSFLPLKSLKILDISGNNMSWLSSTSDDVFSTELTQLRLSSCNINEFPNFLKKQRNLSALVISNNNIKGKVPEWLWNLPSLGYVSLSQNYFDSFEGSQESLLNSSVQLLRLDSNAFQGYFPTFSPSLEYLSAANNYFTGDIPLSLCNRSLFFLDLSNNGFSGSIPRCFRETLSVLNLHNNSLSGRLPDSFNKLYQKLRALDVGHNQIIGKLPRSLVNCTSLEILNVESNEIIDTFPFWLKTLMNLQVMILRSNRFYGPISSPQDPPSFLALRIIDISRNNFTGALSKDYFANWSEALINMPEVYRLPEYMEQDVSYQSSIYLTVKGLSLELKMIPLTYTIIDFSGNRFGGQIPESIGLLKQLVVLDLSNNGFIGHIPSSLAKLTKLESLDLSRNQLSGEIPQELANLSFLGYINVSHNKLKGKIPQSTQFGGQSKSSFEGNIGLCGLPLQRSCLTGNVVSSPQRQQQQNPPKEDQLLNWKATAIGYGPGILVGLAIGHVMATYRPALYYKLFRL